MLAKWCAATACEGVRDLYESRGNRKHFIFWSVIMICMFGASVFFTYRTVLGYLETPKITYVDTVTNATLQMPEILLTYNGGFNMEKFREANLSQEFVKTITASLYFNSRVNSIAEGLNEELAKYMQINNYTMYDTMKSFGYECHDLVVSLVGTYVNETDPCPEAQLMLTDRSNSYVFKNLGQQWYPGLWAGVKLTLSAPNYSFVHIFPQEALELNMNDEFSVTLEHKLGFQTSGRAYPVPRNSKVEMNLNTKRYKRLAGGNRRCTEDSVQYTSNTCFFICWIKEMELTVQCYYVAAVGNGEVYDKSKLCNPFYFVSEFRRRINYSRVQQCQQNCVPSCDEWIYEVTLAYSPLDKLSFNDTISVVMIGYNTMQYTQIEEVAAFTIDMAISNVGGQSGLWLGVSVITIIQALFYLWIALWKKVSRKFNSKQSKEEIELK